MEKCEHCGAVLNTNKNIDKLEDIPEQEIVKRAIEVCLAGNHTISIININGYGKEFGQWLKSHDISVWVETKCPCGNYGDLFNVCECKISQIEEWTKRNKWKQAMAADIIIESTRPRTDSLIRAYQPEPEDQMFRRIERSKKVIIENDSLDYESRSLLKMAVERLGITHQKIAQIKRVATTIAKLEISDRIRTWHISEAIQYTAFTI